MWLWTIAASVPALTACDETDPPADNPRGDALDGSTSARDAEPDRSDSGADPMRDADSAASADSGAGNAGRDSGAADAGGSGAAGHDAAPTDAEAPDAGPVQVSVSGQVLDAWTASTVVGALVSAEGTQPLASDTSDASGEYALELVAGSPLVTVVTRASYRPTRNPPALAVDSADNDVQIVAASDAQRQYTGLGASPTAGTAVVVAWLRDTNGDPLEGIPLADIALLDEQGIPVALGPYFFGAAGDLVSAATLSTSTAFDGEARVGFLDCPPGEHELEVSRAGTPLRAPVTCSADGATLAIPRE